MAPLAAMLGAASLSASAQEDVEESKVEETIIVTGSRIANANVMSPSPVTTVGAEQIQARGTVRVEDMLNTLPQVSPSEGSGRANEAAGTANVDLRGLGAERTLVLVDGRRMPYGSPISAPADLNQIPSMLVERVEVLTGGASAVYGADAVAGVVNFIMKDDFEGIMIDTQVGAFQTGNSNDMLERTLNASNQPVPGSTMDGESVDINVVFGMNGDDGRGNITGYFNWKKQNEVLQGERISSACALGYSDGVFSCGGSGTTFPGQFTSLGGGIAPFSFTLAEDGGIRDYDPSTDTYNYAPLNHFIRPNERYSFGAMGHYDVSDKVELYGSFAFTNDVTTAQIAPSGDFLQTNTINCDNPMLSDEQVQTICIDNGIDPNAADIADRTAALSIGRRNVEGGGRRNEIEHTSYRVVGGFRGDLDDVWSYDVFGQYAKVSYSDSAENFFNLDKLRNALEVRIDPETGEAACQVAIDGTDPTCAPYNIFELGGVTQEALDYIQSPGFREGEVTQEMFSAVLTGDMTQYGIATPWSETGLQVVFGAEYREEYLTQKNDALTREGKLGTARPDVEGGVNVYEFFTELQLPLVENRPGIDELAINGAYRYSDYYDTTGSQGTYALGLTYAPVPEYRFRAQFQRATRSPNPIELYSPQSPFEFTLPANANGLYDPCAGANPARSQTECARTGVTAAQYGNIADNPAAQFRNISGGNPNLDVEKSNTYTFGVVASPSFVPGLNLSVDYFNIEVEDFIGSIPEEESLNQCLTTGDEYFCGLINRGANGTLWAGDDAYVIATKLNTGSLKTSGVDVSASYNFDVASYGSVRVDYLATFLDTLDKEPLPGLDVIECAGYFASTNSSCGTSKPKYRHNLPVSWMTPWGDLTVRATWRHIGSVDLVGSNVDNVNTVLEARDYLDLSMKATVRDGVALRFGVNNVFDRNPPVSTNVGSAGGSFGNGNTFPQVYDALGRYMFAGVNVTF
ncbi:TonB-dependent receptor domain-containing protein [Hyphomonas beringensis]|nr:TonB-dependent receptor [Hyphomonas beringensis]